ncbi:hypothetical protein DUI87_07635 [Hirundo rustica rustica]|uniref:Uncharacterized protein n=1 Tax=Hirundo rustica rustica TaxID=333673 RepID=A0A3M0KVK1_HIRRU|nr:hypothetical protein DUI87_07635 [Hirundo rustica rustica]
MLILGYGQTQPKHRLTTPGPARTVSIHSHHMDAKGQEQIHGDPQITFPSGNCLCQRQKRIIFDDMIGKMLSGTKNVA